MCREREYMSRTVLLAHVRVRQTGFLPWGNWVFLSAIESCPRPGILNNARILRQHFAADSPKAQHMAILRILSRGRSPAPIELSFGYAIDPVKGLANDNSEISDYQFFPIHDMERRRQNPGTGLSMRFNFCRRETTSRSAKPQPPRERARREP